MHALNNTQTIKRNATHASGEPTDAQ